MARPTIADLARAADVSISTVDRVLNGRDPVRTDKAERVLAAAERIGFRATAALRQRLGPERPERTFVFLLQQETESFYALLGRALIRAVAASPAVRGQVRVDFVSDFEPAVVAARLRKLGRLADAIGVVTADHPLVTQAIADLKARGVPVLALVSDLTAQDRAAYIGVDNWKAGRTAAWAIAQRCRAPGAVGILIGNHRYLCQDSAESGFRSYLREHAPHLHVLQPLTSFEEPRYAYENTRDLLRRQVDLQGLFVAGGGIDGVVQALKERADEGAAANPVTVVREITPETRSGLIEGTLHLVIAHPLRALAEAVVQTMVRLTTGTRLDAFHQAVLPLEVCTPENV